MAKDMPNNSVVALRLGEIVSYQRAVGYVNRTNYEESDKFSELPRNTCKK